MALGRSTEPRVVTVDTTDTDATITGAAGTFREEDAGAPIEGDGIPAGATLATITSDTSAELSAAATATASDVEATVTPDASGYGFSGWSPETDAESETYAVGAVGTPPSVLADDVTPVEYRQRTYE